MPERARRALWVVVLLALVPAALLLAERLRVEGERPAVAIVMDADALAEQARALGLDPFELALRYREAGLPGLAIYEATPESLAEAGRVAAMSGREAIAAALARGDEPPPVPGASTLVHEIAPGATEWLVAKAARPPERVTWNGRDWWVLPGDVLEEQPAGPDLETWARYREAGFDLAYRPRNAPGLRAVGADVPADARYLVHAGLDLSGHPHALSELIDASEGHLTAIIEGTPQDGLTEVRGKLPTVRLLSFNQDYINQHLEPIELIDKYLLAAHERNVRLLYLRPYTEQQLGDMVENTLELITGLRRALDVEGFQVEPLPVEAAGLEGYDPSPWLRAAVGLGILAALGLLAGLYPWPWGALAALAVAGLGVWAGGADWDALALVAALTFPVLGYATFSRGVLAFALATGVSLIGGALLAAVGSDPPALLALEPFAGVAATLVVPPALFVAHAMLAERRPAAWLRTLWRQELRLGPLAVAGVALAGLALVVIRRGNTPIIGASALELEVRELLSEAFARPRFKELVGHPLALLGLTGTGWPQWLRAMLLTGGVIAQASILNSFSHYHTPLLVSLERTLIALGLGLALGVLGIGLARLAVAGGRRWLRET